MLCPRRLWRYLPPLPVSHPARAQVTALGTSAMLLDIPGELSLPTQQKIWALARTVECWPQIAEAVPGMNNLMLTLSEPPSSHGEWLKLAESLRQAWEESEPLSLDGRVVDLPVIYGGDGGPHIAEQVQGFLLLQREAEGPQNALAECVAT